MSFLSFRAFFKMANPIVYEIEPNQIILADQPDQCEISYEGFEQDNGMQHHIETGNGGGKRSQRSSVQCPP